MQNIGRCDGAYPGRVQSDAIYILDLDGTNEDHFNIPTNATVAVIAATGNFYVLTNGQTAAIPVASQKTGANTNPELNPTVLSVVAGNLFSAIAPSACIVTISFYQDTDKLYSTSNPNINNPP